MNEFIGKWRNFITEDKTPLRENFEVGDTVVFRGVEGEGGEMTVVGKRKMFAVKDNGRDLMAILVELPDGTTSEYDETQLTAAPTITSDDELNALVDEFSSYVDDPSNPLGEPGSLDPDDVLDSVLDEELFTPNEMGDKAVEDESNSSAFQEGKGQDLADKYVAKLRQEFKNLSDDELDEFKKTLATAFDMNESVNEGSSMRVTKQMWQKMSDDEKENALLTVFEDPDTAQKWIERKWNSLPGSVTRDMHTESVNEGHSLEGKDLDLLKSLKDQIDQGVLDSKKKDAFVALLNNLINTNISEQMSKEGRKNQIKDIEDSLESGESDGEPLTNETEMELQKELKRLKSMKEGLPKGFWDKKIDAEDEDQDGKVDESYATLVNKIEKSGKSEKAAKAIAGAVASYKSKGGGKGPTAKQK
jgi:hypothetical protein